MQANWKKVNKRKQQQRKLWKKQCAWLTGRASILQIGHVSLRMNITHTNIHTHREAYYNTCSTYVLTHIHTFPGCICVRREAHILYMYTTLCYTFYGKVKKKRWMGLYGFRFSSFFWCSGWCRMPCGKKTSQRRFTMRHAGRASTTKNWTPPIILLCCVAHSSHIILYLTLFGMWMCVSVCCMYANGIPLIPNCLCGAVRSIHKSRHFLGISLSGWTRRAAWLGLLILYFFRNVPHFLLSVVLTHSSRLQYACSMSRQADNFRNMFGIIHHWFLAFI